MHRKKKKKKIIIKHNRKTDWKNVILKILMLFSCHCLPLNIIKCIADFCKYHFVFDEEVEIIAHFHARACFLKSLTSFSIIFPFSYGDVICLHSLFFHFSRRNTQRLYVFDKDLLSKQSTKTMNKFHPKKLHMTMSD